MAHGNHIDRRGFLTQMGRGATLAGLGVMAASAQARARAAVEKADPHAPKTGRIPGADDVVGLGIIGVGGMGSGHLGELLEWEKKGEKIQVRAISDVYRRRQNSAVGRVKDVTGRDIEAYNDYKKLLERDDIDAVVIATPDHWHARNAMDAMDAGKDVYCQKPVTLTVEESLDVRDKVLATGRVFQCGAQGCSEDFYWQARKFIKNGGIGKVLWAQGDYSRNSKGGPDDRGGEWNWPIDEDASDDPAAGEAHIDWQQWLGNAPQRPFSKPRFFQFRKYWDYSGGISTDLLYHLLAPLTIALDAQAPERATGSGGIYVQKDDREVPDTFMMNLDYPDEFTIVMTSSMANEQGLPLVIRGHRGTIYRHENGAMRVVAEPQFQEWFKKEHGSEELIVPAEPRLDHVHKWLECIKTRGETHLDAETAYRAMAGIKMGVEAYRQDKVIFWDGAQQQYVDAHPRPNRDSKYPAASA